MFIYDLNFLFTIYCIRMKANWFDLFFITVEWKWISNSQNTIIKTSVNIGTTVCTIFLYMHHIILVCDDIVMLLS